MLGIAFVFASVSQIDGQAEDFNGVKMKQKGL